MKRKYMNRTILKIALIGYVALLVLLLTANIMMLHNNYTVIQNQITGQLQDMAEEINERLDITGSFLYNIYANNNNFQSLSSSTSTIDTYNDMYELNNTFSLYQITHDCFDCYFIMSSQSENVLYKADDIPADTVARIKELIAGVLHSNLAMEQYFFYREEDSCYGLIIYHQGNAAVAGVCDLGQYRDLLGNSLAESGEVFVWFEDNYEENNPAASELPSSVSLSSATHFFTQRNHHQTLYGARVGERSIWLLFWTNRSVFSYISLLQIFLLLVTLASVAGVASLYHALVRLLVKPMYKLMDVMEGIQKNSIEQIPEMNLPFYEMNLMNITLKNMVAEIRNQRIHYYEEKLSRQEAQLQFMQLQLKPHFFLNCLKSLNTMATDAGLHNMQDMILKISDYLRYFLRVDRKTTALREEITFTQDYVKLQNLLANRRIECRILMEEDLGGWEVPVLCIQTFIENSVKYVNVTQGDIHLPIQVQINRLQSEDEEELLNIVVSDSGQGYPESLLPDLNRRYFYGINSVGINNIKQRCDILYGERAEYSFYNMEGAVSELFIPVSPERNAEGITEHETLISR